MGFKLCGEEPSRPPPHLGGYAGGGGATTLYPGSSYFTPPGSRRSCARVLLQRFTREGPREPRPGELVLAEPDDRIRNEEFVTRGEVPKTRNGPTTHL